MGSVLKNFRIIFGVSLCLALPVIHAETKNNVCYSCNGAPASQCLQTTVCQPDEKCFMEKISTSTNQTLFVAGCRSNALCSLMMSPLGKRSITGQCADCCESSSGFPCNANLCNFGDNAVVHCRACDGLHYGPSGCTLQQCAPNQYCHTGIRVVGISRKITYGCEEKRVCEALALAVGTGRRSVRKWTTDNERRDVSIGIRVCDACCNTDDCNSMDCFQLQKQMGSLVASPTAG